MQHPPVAGVDEDQAVIGLDEQHMTHQRVTEGCGMVPLEVMDLH